MPEVPPFLVLICMLAAILLGIAVLVLLLLDKNARKREEQTRAQESRRLWEEIRGLSELTHALPGREETNQQLYNLNEALQARLNGTAEADARRIEALSVRLDGFGDRQEARLNRVDRTLQEKLSQNEQRMDTMRTAVENSMKALREENARKLQEMRLTVDEKLHTTLDKRLSESFSLVNERLEQVYKGLGEMQSLAGGVGDLKRVLTNVKTRGIWGEMQLGNILSQMLTPQQYAENCEVEPGSGKRVEYAVILPGRDEQKMYLPLDSKFPMQDYERLLQASEAGDPAEVQRCAQGLENAFRAEAKRIHDKYIVPPFTTDFAVMFVPVEGLYAEALHRRGLAESLQRDQRVIIAGPSTLAALLSSLQVGFRTLAIEKRSSEVWQLLGAVKTEFMHFNELLDAAQKRMQGVSESIEKASRRGRMIERKLKQVESLDEGFAARLMGESETGQED